MPPGFNFVGDRYPHVNIKNAEEVEELKAECRKSLLLALIRLFLNSAKSCGQNMESHKISVSTLENVQIIMASWRFHHMRNGRRRMPCVVFERVSGYPCGMFRLS